MEEREAKGEKRKEKESQGKTRKAEKREEKAIKGKKRGKQREGKGRDRVKVEERDMGRKI